MKANKVAKNLLQGKTCDNCEHGYQMSRCTKDLYDWNVLKDKSSDGTCECWKKRAPFKGKKLNMKWSMEAAEALKSFSGINVEEELIKIAINEIKRELKKNK